MADQTHEVVLAPNPDGSWEAHIPAIPTLRFTGETSNQALAQLWESFRLWQTEQRTLNTTSTEERGAIWKKVYYSLRSHYQLLPAAAPGDFSVDSDCCITCGVPQMVAPDLVGWTEEPFVSCYWKKQPETPQEFEQAFKIFEGQEVGCHRYAGNDPAILARIGMVDCDHPDANSFRSRLWGTQNESPKSEPPIAFLQRLARLFKRY